MEHGDVHELANDVGREGPDNDAGRNTEDGVEGDVGDREMAAAGIAISIWSSTRANRTSTIPRTVMKRIPLRP